MRRIVATVVFALVALVVGAAPASAHSVGGVSATDYRTTVDAVTPPLPGVTVRVIEAGSRLELRNTGPEVVVPGYDGEPYLRVGPDGAFENLRSGAVYLNKGRKVNATDPRAQQRSDPSAAPDWHRISDGQTVRWHDHRTHWMGSSDPPQVQRSPDQRHVIFGAGGETGPAWEIAVTRATGPVANAVVSGRLLWLPGPSPFPWFGLALVVGLAVAALGLLTRWHLALAVALLVLLAVDVVHATGIGFAYGGGLGTHLVKVLAGSLYSIVGWILAIVAVQLLRKRSIDGLYAAVFAALSMALFGGLLDLGSLSRSDAPFAFALWLNRLTVALALGAGVGIALGSILAIRRNPDVLVGDDGWDDDPVDGGQPLRPIPS